MGCLPNVGTPMFYLYFYAVSLLIAMHALAEVPASRTRLCVTSERRSADCAHVQCQFLCVTVDVNPGALSVNSNSIIYTQTSIGSRTYDAYLEHTPHLPGREEAIVGSQTAMEPPI